jgi:iron complex transport system substrate-binding protein
LRGGRAVLVCACLLLVGAALFASPAMALTVTDDAGIAVHLERPAQRVISLSPHLTEMMYAIGAGMRLVGAVRGSDFPLQAASLPQIGDASGLDFERIVASRADLLLAWGSGNRAIDIARLRSLGLNVLVLEPRRLEDIPRHLALLGEVTGLRTEAQIPAREFKTRVHRLQQHYAGRARLRVFFAIWYQPLFTINGDHIISKVLDLCAADNIFAGLPRLASEVSLEQVLLLNPDVIVMGSEAASVGSANWAAFPHLKAVHNGDVYSVSADLITRQTPRIMEAAERVCADLDHARR